MNNVIEGKPRLLVKAVGLMQAKLGDFRGYYFEDNQFIFEWGYFFVAQEPKERLSVYYDLGTDENLKVDVARALQGIENVSYHVGSRYRRNGSSFEYPNSYAILAYDQMMLECGDDNSVHVLRELLMCSYDEVDELLSALDEKERERL